MSAADDRALALLERYLAEGARSHDALRVNAWRLGKAEAMLCNLLGLFEYSTPDTTRALFERWRAEQANDAFDASGARDMQAEGGAQ